MFYNILDNINGQLKARFDHFGELAFLGFGWLCKNWGNVTPFWWHQKAEPLKICLLLFFYFTLLDLRLISSDFIVPKRWGMSVNLLDSSSTFWPRRIWWRLFLRRQSYFSWCSLYRLQQCPWKGPSLLWKDWKHTVEIGLDNFHPRQLSLLGQRDFWSR